MGRGGFVLRSILGWSFIISGGILSALTGFLSFASVWVGLSNLHRKGWWVPVLAGILLVTLVCWLYLRATRAVLSKTRDQGLIVSAP